MKNNLKKKKNCKNLLISIPSEDDLNLEELDIFWVLQRPWPHHKQAQRMGFTVNQLCSGEIKVLGWEQIFV